MMLSYSPAFAGMEGEAASIIKVEKYLQSLGTLKSRFIQTAYNGEQLAGNFYLSRPGKLRFEYDAPIEDFIVADGFFIYFYDAETGGQTNALIGQTMADFILRDNITFGKDVNVESVINNDDFIQVTLTQMSEPEAGSISLYFDRDPFELKEWYINDAQGYITKIELLGMQRDIDLPRKTFIYRDPKKAENRGYN